MLYAAVTVSCAQKSLFTSWVLSIQAVNYLSSAERCALLCRVSPRQSDSGAPATELSAMASDDLEAPLMGPR